MPGLSFGWNITERMDEYLFASIRMGTSAGFKA